MSAGVGRAALVFSLALASLSRLAGRTPAGVPATRRSGRIVTLSVRDGALLVETERGSVLLLVAWDATIRGPEASLRLDDLRIGDAVEWRDEGGQAVARIDDLLVVAPGRQ